MLNMENLKSDTYKLDQVVKFYFYLLVQTKISTGRVSDRVTIRVSGSVQGKTNRVVCSTPRDTGYWWMGCTWYV